MADKKLPQIDAMAVTTHLVQISAMVTVLIQHYTAHVAPLLDEDSGALFRSLIADASALEPRIVDALAKATAGRARS